jgi:uncharacterized LabA/DUF88 family protein
MGTVMYVDGFNLYYGALKGTAHKWLDLEAVARRLLPKDRVVGIRYFTALVSARPSDPSQPARQQAYLRALATSPLITIHLGHYLSHRARMPLADPPASGPRTVEVIKTEEKGSDVNLATHLLLDAFRRRCDTAVVVTNDSDLTEPIRVAEAELGVRVGIVNPHPARRRSHTLQATFFKQLRPSTLGACQLPPTVHDANGSIHKPPTW